MKLTHKNLMIGLIAAFSLAVQPIHAPAANPVSSQPDAGTIQTTDDILIARGALPNNTYKAHVGSAATQPSSAFLSSTGTIPPASLPTPGASTLGGVQAATPTTNQFLTGIGTDGIPTKAQPSFSNISGNVTATQLPNPTSSSLGGVQSATATANQFLTGITTLGVPTKAQPAFTDISGTLAAVQLPNPSASTLGGVQSAAAVSHQFLTSITTLGVPVLAQPAFTDITGTASVNQGGTGVTASQGNGTKVQLSTGTTTTNNIVKYDVNGNAIDSGVSISAVGRRRHHRAHQRRDGQWHRQRGCHGGRDSGQNRFRHHRHHECRVFNQPHADRHDDRGGPHRQRCRSAFCAFGRGHALRLRFLHGHSLRHRVRGRGRGKPYHQQPRPYFQPGNHHQYRHHQPDECR